MQIDYHFGATYVIARTAGFNHEDALTVAHSAQYVDDAVNSGTIRFDHEFMYSRISSAHRMLDYRNFKELANHRVWIPFHFLPGNSGKGPDEKTPGDRVLRLVCLPNSKVAQDMVAACINERNTPYALHRLGICMHVYADTWAHQGFAGVSHKINEVHGVRKLDEHGHDEEFRTKIVDFFGDVFDKVTSRFLGDVLPLGHGAALSYPDRPWLRWSYKNGLGKLVIRDNPRDFLAASHELCRAMRRYRKGNPRARVTGLPKVVAARMDELFRGQTNSSGEKRLKAWAKAVKKGEFGFPGETLKYIPKGRGSWKFKALGTERELDSGREVYKFRRPFIDSDWKRFHDALMAHRYSIINEVLPRYGIVTA